MPIDIRSGLSRRDASQRLLTVHGLSYTETTLANMATDGDGPIYRIIRGRALYMPADIDAWAVSRIGRPVRRAADARSEMTAEVAA